MNYKTFRTFTESSDLFETVQDAKNYLLKRYATKKEIKTSEIPEDVKQKILNDPGFKEVRSVIDQKFPGYTLGFTKFFYEQGAKIEELKEIADLLFRYKSNLSKDLSMSVNDFAKIQPTDDDNRPGYEVLGDELRNIPRKIKLRKLYNEFTAKMRKAFSKATDKQIDQLTEISNQLERLPEKDGLDAWDEFTKNLKKYEDTRTYPEYKDEMVAFADIIKDANIFIEKWQQSEDELIRELKKMGAQVGFLYNKDGYVVVSTRSPESLRAVAGDTNWCIRNDSTFWSYGQGRVQLVIINRNIPVSDNNSLLGITVNKDNTIHTDADRPNRRIRGRDGNSFRDIKSLLEGMRFPSELVNSVMDGLPFEKDIKLALEEFFRNQKDLTPPKIIASLINLNKGFLQGKIEEEEWERISGIVSEIIKSTEKLRTSEFLRFFKENGILGVSAWNVFRKVVGDDYTDEDMKEIYDSTLDSFETMEYIVSRNKSAPIKQRSDEIKKIEQSLSNKEAVMGEFKSKK